MLNLRSSLHHFILLFFIFFFITTVHAAWLENEPIIIKQPDSKIINCFATGDEYYNWAHDAHGYTIIQNHKTGWWVYAIKENDELVPSDYIIGTVNPANMGISPHLNISPGKMLAIRQNIISNTPKRPVLSSQRSGSPSNATNQGNLNNLVIFLRFSDEKPWTDNLSVYDNMFNNVPGTSSLKNYYNFVSFNTLHISSTYYPTQSGSTVLSYQSHYSRAYYMPYDSITNNIGYINDSARTTREHSLLRDAIDSISPQIPSSLNLDYNNDGYVDNVCFIVDSSTTAWNTLLWPHMWVLYSYTVKINGKQVWGYNFQVQNNLKSEGASVLCHEMFHTLGAPDLYHYVNNGIDPVGRWDLMANNLTPPQSMGAWMKFRYGKWITSIPEITKSGTYTLSSMASDTHFVYKTSSPYSSNEFFVLEYRNKTGLFEGSVPESGLLIYRIDTLNALFGNGNGPQDELYIYRPNGNNSVNGLINNAAFSQDSNRTRFNFTTNPSCFLSDGSNGGIFISNITKAGGSTISFTVNILKPMFKASDTVICANNTIQFTDTSIGTVTSRLWTFPGGKPNTSTLANPTINYDTAGVYDVSLKVYDSSYSNVLTKTKFIRINPLPKAPVTITTDGYQLISSSTSGNQWYDSTGILTGDTSKYLVPENSGHYYVIVKNAFGCSIQSLTFSFNKSGIQDNSNPVMLTIYPNPSHGNFTLSITKLLVGKIHLSIINSMGEIVYTKPNIEFNNSWSGEFNLSNLSHGLYSVLLQGDHFVEVKRIIIE